MNQILGRDAEGRVTAIRSLFRLNDLLSELGRRTFWGSRVGPVLERSVGDPLDPVSRSSGRGTMVPSWSIPGRTRLRLGPSTHRASTTAKRRGAVMRGLKCADGCCSERSLWRIPDRDFGSAYALLAGCTFWDDLRQSNGIRRVGSDG
jgi:hypothetical protein